MQHDSMNPELRTLKLQKIDEHANREKATVDYLMNLIESDEVRMRELFLGPEEQAFAELKSDKLLFDRVSVTISDFRNRIIRNFGKISIFAIDNPPLPTATEILGWEAYSSPWLGKGQIEAVPGIEYTHQMKPTRLGREIVDGLLFAQGTLDSRHLADYYRFMNAKKFLKSSTAERL